MLSFTDANGNLFNRWGRLGKVLVDMRTNQVSQETNLIDLSSGIVGQLQEESDIAALIGDSYIGILQSIGGTVIGTLQGTAAAVANRMIFRDSPRLNQTLTSGNLSASLQEIIRQMKVSGASVLAATITATPQLFSALNTNIGNGIIVCSVKRPLDGKVLENSFAETISVVCTDDSYIGGATAGSETLAIVGTGSENDVSAFDWPLGSNCNTTVQTVNGNLDNQGGNLLTNSGFEEWTSNVPDNWELLVGTAGVDIFEESSIVYDPESGGKSMRLAGDGATRIQFWQPFDDSDGTEGALEALTQYAVNVWVRRGGTRSDNGHLLVELVDEDNNVVNDQDGNPNTFTIDLTTLTTVWTAFNGVFRTPLVMPSALYLQVRGDPTQDPPDAGTDAYLDKMAMTEMTQLYSSGPYAAVFSGSVNFVQGDLATIAVTNSRGTAGTLNTWQTLMSRLFPGEVYGNELLLPSSNVPTISDDLITR